MDDLYQTLGITKTATADQIKKAYRDAAFKYHPDRNPDDKVAEEKFKKISAAYSVLGDEKKRAQYDQYGSTDEYATAQQSRYNNQAQSPFGDDFWGWYQQQANGQRSQQQYRQSYSYNTNSNWQQEPTTRKEAFVALIRNLLFLLFCLYVLRWSLLLLPIGPILCLLGIVRSATGFLHAIQVLVKPKKDKNK